MKQIELELGGEKRTFYFGLGFLGNLLEKENISIQEIGVKAMANPYKWNPLIMYHSVSYGFLKKGETVPFTSHDVVDWIEYAGGFESDVYKAFELAFSQSLVKDVPQTNDKKKVTKK
jgi:hypothetical protein